MTTLRKLAGQTAIYGVSSIVARVMNFLLTPLYTHYFITEEYGVVTELYAYVAFIIVLLTYGMETTFFRFGSKATSVKDTNRVFSTSFISVIATSVLFIFLISANLDPVARAMGYGDYAIYILFFAWIVGLDAMSTIPMARLRLKDKPIPFAAINLVSIFTNIGLNLLFIVYCPHALEDPSAPGHNLILTHYDASFGVGYIFLANLISSALKFLLLVPWMVDIKFGFHYKLYKKLLPYALPLLFLGLAGIVNETFDRAFYQELSGLDKKTADAELGVYGACYKVAMLLSIGIQAYRFAAEPFIFSIVNPDESKKTQGMIMKYYFIVASFIALCILCFLDVALLLIGEEYREGKMVIPILIAAYVLFGVVFNLSFWYKMSDRTIYGALIAATGAVVTIATNIVLIPRIGYYGAATATFLAYLAMAILSYSLGRKKYFADYPLKEIGFYAGLATALIIVNYQLNFSGILRHLIAGISVLIYVGATFSREKKLQDLFRK